jgi:VWFA-related protein
MRRAVASLLLFALAIPPLPAQQPDQEPPLPVVRATTRAVLVDLIVTDKQGNPITDLKPEEVVLKESGKQQTLTSLRYERSGGAAKPLPSGIYSNRPEYTARPGPVTIVLLDALNTTVQNQQYARQQFLRYLAKQFTPGMRMAVYGLTNNLIQVQPFTSDYSKLKEAIENYRPPMEPNSPSASSNINDVAIYAPMGGEQGLYGIISRFMSDPLPQVLEARLATTLAALRELARITGGMTGRKNLIWLSAGFPVAFTPGERTASYQSETFVIQGTTEPVACQFCPPSVNEASVDIMQRFRDEIRRTSAAMTSSQLALYPVDARGLFVAIDARETGSNAGSSGDLSGPFGGNIAGLTSTHFNMKEMAAQTGGKAYYNRNDLDNAVALASQDGNAYYSLSYVSANKKLNGDYRSIKIEVKRPNVQVRHRAGYFAYALDKPQKGDKGENKAPGKLTLADVMFDSTLVLFDAQVTPQPGKATVVFRVEPKTVSWGDPGKHDVNINLYVLAQRSDSEVAGVDGFTFAHSLNDSQYREVVQRGLVVPLEIVVPKGEYSLKLAVRDNRNRDDRQHDGAAQGTLVIDFIRLGGAAV